MRSKDIGDFSFFNSYMSQPKSQLQTFSAWAGVDSDISYYLNSHHVSQRCSMAMLHGMFNADRRSARQIDVHAWLVEGLYKPVKVTASASTGIATQEPYNCAPQTEDTITLLTEWESLKQPGRKGTAVYTASWTAPQKSGVHSEQYWNMVCSKVSLASSVIQYLNDIG